METDKSQTKKGNKTIWIIFIVILILAIFGTAGYFAWKKYIEPKAKTASDSTSNNSTNTVSDSTETENWKTYKNNELGLTFKYPATWGEPQIAANNYSEDSGPAFSGKDYSIIFSGADGEIIASVAGYSNDFSAYDSGYVGDKADLDLPEILAPTKGDNAYNIYLIRKKATVAGEKTYYDIDFSSIPEASGYNFSTIAYLNAKSSEYAGITISRNYKTINDKLNQNYTGNENEIANQEGRITVANLDVGTISDKTALNEYQEYLLWLETFQYNK